MKKNTATNLLDSLGVKSKDQKIAEMAGAVTRLVLNDAISKAKAQAKIRDETLAKNPPENG
jgi:hypothetical protein